MEKVYDLTDESEYFMELCYSYLSCDYNYQKCIFMHNREPANYHELLRFAVHQAECGENVYIINFPRQIQVLHHPKTLFFLEKWSDFFDVSNVEHVLILAISSQIDYDNYMIQGTYTHLLTNFKSVISISFQC